MSRKESLQLFCHIPFIQIFQSAWDKAGDMSRMVTAIITAGRNRAKQRRDMRKKALMKGLGTGPDCQIERTW